MTAVAKIFDFNTRNEFIPEVILGNAKLKKNGDPKRTRHNRNHRNTTWVDPIRNIEDINKIIKYMNNRIENEHRHDYEWQWERNKLYFIIAVYSGFRVSDLVGARPGTKYRKKDKDGNIWYEYPQWTGLKWSDLYEKDGITIKDQIIVKELKTSRDGKPRIRKIVVTPKVKEYIQDYVGKYLPDTTSDDYVFVNRQKKRLSAATIDDFLKEVTAECNIEGDYSTHSLRKTYVYHKYLSYLAKSDEEFALGKCLKLTGHRNTSDLLRYLGLKCAEEYEEAIEFDNYWEEIF